MLSYQCGKDVGRDLLSEEPGRPICACAWTLQLKMAAVRKVLPFACPTQRLQPMCACVGWWFVVVTSVLTLAQVLWFACGLTCRFALCATERPAHLNMNMWTLPREGVSSLRHTPHTRARVYDLCGQDHGGAQNVHVATQNEDFRVTLDLEQKQKKT